MLLRPLLALSLLTSSFVARAQVFAWAAPVGYGVGKAVAVDAQGNVYACGNANTQVDFDPGPGEALSPAGSGVNGDNCAHTVVCRLRRPATLRAGIT